MLLLFLSFRARLSIRQAAVKERPGGAGIRDFFDTFKSYGAARTQPVRRYPKRDVQRCAFDLIEAGAGASGRPVLPDGKRK
jgi:hypothetical protein